MMPRLFLVTLLAWLSFPATSIAQDVPVVFAQMPTSYV